LVHFAANGRFEAQFVNSIFSLYALAAQKMPQPQNHLRCHAAKTGHSCKAQQDQSGELTDCGTKHQFAAPTPMAEIGVSCVLGTLMRWQIPAFVKK